MGRVLYAGWSTEVAVWEASVGSGCIKRLERTKGSASGLRLQKSQSWDTVADDANVR